MTTNGALTINKQSPFTPGSPVPVELFVGRTKQISEILRFVDQSAAGKLQTVFLLGDRGTGKSSIASFVRYLAINQRNMLGVHVFLGRTSNVDDMVRQVLDQLLKESKNQKWYSNIAHLFGNYIEQVGLFDISIRFAPPKEKLDELVAQFPAALHSLIEKTADEKSALFIVLDDIDGLLVNQDFANWFKSFVDGVATHYTKFPVFIMLVGLPEQRDVLAEFQPSLMRIFRIIEIERLSSDEVASFISRAFDKVGLKVTEDALGMMVRFSSGLPVIMHEIGDAVFWEDQDGEVSRDDVVRGVLTAADNVCKKYLNPQVYRAVRSPRYKAILNKLGTRETFSRSFKKKALEEQLNDQERRIFGNFLTKMTQLGVIEADLDEGRGTYKFVNDIYPVCIYLKGSS